jgi:hypothetical protein
MRERAESAALPLQTVPAGCCCAKQTLPLPGLLCGQTCRLCSKVSVKYQECKSTCNTCDELRSTIQADTKLQVRVVQQLSACIDLLPSCAAWVKESRCTREPKSMLELCQARHGRRRSGYCSQLHVGVLRSRTISLDASKQA